MGRPGAHAALCRSESNEVAQWSFLRTLAAHSAAKTEIAFYPKIFRRESVELLRRGEEDPPSRVIWHRSFNAGLARG
jgi:hypothetical protein